MRIGLCFVLFAIFCFVIFSILRPMMNEALFLK
jgi:hypothetical protein